MASEYFFQDDRPGFVEGLLVLMFWAGLILLFVNGIGIGVWILAGLIYFATTPPYVTRIEGHKFTKGEVEQLDNMTTKFLQENKYEEFITDLDNVKSEYRVDDYKFKNLIKDL